jgi:hypothetical protein
MKTELLRRQERASAAHSIFRRDYRAAERGKALRGGFLRKGRGRWRGLVLRVGAVVVLVLGIGGRGRWVCRRRRKKGRSWIASNYCNV